MSDKTTVPYRPSSGTEGADFMAQWCDRCKRDEAFQAGDGDSCSIAAASLVYRVGDDEYPKEWVYNPRPCCTVFDPIDQPSIIQDKRQETLNV